MGIHEYVKPNAYCEISGYCRRVLLERQSQGIIPRAPIWNNIRTLKSKSLPFVPDIILGGFPCQDISTCGRGEGLDGERSKLFFEITRLCRDLRPRFVFLENVPAITVRGLDRVLLEFTEMGYDTRWTIVSAAEVGAKHRRERWFLLAHTPGESVRLPKSGSRQRKTLDATSVVGARKITDASSERLESRGPSIGFKQKQPFSIDLLEGDNWDEYASFFHRMDYGLRFRSQRLKALGNAVVPLQAREAFMRLMGLK